MASSCRSSHLGGPSAPWSCMMRKCGRTDQKTKGRGSRSRRASREVSKKLAFFDLRVKGYGPKSLIELFGPIKGLTPKYECLLKRFCERQCASVRLCCFLRGRDETNSRSFLGRPFGSSRILTNMNWWMSEHWGKKQKGVLVGQHDAQTSGQTEKRPRTANAVTLSNGNSANSVISSYSVRRIASARMVSRTFWLSSSLPIGNTSLSGPASCSRCLRV